jgi:hypothetical protein
MSRLLAFLVAALIAGGAMAQSTGTGTPAGGSPDSSSTQDPPTGGGATTGGVLGASGGAIVQPGSTPATSGQSGTGAMGAPGAAVAQPRPGSATGSAGAPPTSSMGRDCPSGMQKKDNGCLPAPQGEPAPRSPQ